MIFRKSLSRSLNYSQRHIYVYMYNVHVHIETRNGENQISILCKAVFYNVGVSPYPWCFEKKNTTDSKKAHFITLENGVRGVSKTPRSQKSVVF